MTLISFDANGAVRSVRDQVPGAAGTLTQRSDGGPLLVARRVHDGPPVYNESWAQLLADDGSDVVPAFHLRDDVRTSAPGAFVGDAFLWAEGDQTGAITVFHIDLDGHATTAGSLSVGRILNVGASALTWTGAEARIVSRIVTDLAPGDGFLHMWWQRVRQDGMLIDNPIAMPNTGEEQDYCSFGLTTLGNDTILVRQHVAEHSTELLRIDQNGALVIPPVRLNQGPSGYCFSGMARVGADIFVAWSVPAGSRSAIELARVRFD